MDGSPLFDWDDSNTEHLARHDVSREEFEQVFEFPRLEVEQQRKGEHRFWVLGRTAMGRYLTIIYVLRGAKIRAVTAHTTKRRNRRLYEESTQSWD